LIVAPLREHSRKPDEMYDLIETTWPGPRLELFARYRRDGWLQWGNEELKPQAAQQRELMLGEGEEVQPDEEAQPGAAF
jgi:N6-adenosine-specific RNA methylase IME4